MYQNKGGRHGVDPVPSRHFAVNEYPELPEHVLEVIRQAQKKRRASAS